jgi:predicted dehydrogenase
MAHELVKLGIGIHGLNGHQIHNCLFGHPRARLVATSACDFATAHASLAPKPGIANDPAIRHYANLNDMLVDPQVQLVSLCSPRRSDQADDAIRCLRAGRHVYAEKPAAMDEQKLDEILAESKTNGCYFHEMSGTVFCQPYYAARQFVAAGHLGEIVHVFAQKSYQARLSERPQDESVDGGLVLQCGIHAARMVEQITGIRITRASVHSTKLGNPYSDGGLRMAASLALELENGAVGSIMANYLCPPSFKHWNNEQFRVFGTAGFLEITDGATASAVYLNDGTTEPLETLTTAPDFLDEFINSIIVGTPMPLSLEDELHPLRILLRATRRLGEK